METKTLLWLDDYRDPHQLKDGIKHWLVFSPVRGTYEVHWVKDYKEFTDWITENGLPTGICFDHDLSDFQALQSGHPELMDDVSWPETEKTGMDCAKWLTDYCMDNNEELPLWNIQSANPVGAKNIRSWLTQFEKEHVIK